MSEDNFKAGAFYIDAFSIVNQYNETVDIRQMVINFQLFESIYKKFVTGEVSIFDGMNLLKNFRFTGQEFVRISIRQRDVGGDPAPAEFAIDKTFRVYKVANVQKPRESITTYVLKICDPRLFYCRRKRLSKVMRGSYDQMLQSVLLEEAHIKGEEFDQWTTTVPENNQFIVPNWTVSRFIDFAVNNSNYSQQAEYKNGMFFFQTLNGGFRFTSIDQMFQQEFPLVFSYKPRSADLDTDKVGAQSEAGINTMISAYEKPQLFDTLRGTMGGAYASMLKVYDPVRKIEEDIVYDMAETFKKGKHLSGHPMLLLDEHERTLTTGNLIDTETDPVVNEIDIDLAPNKEFESVVLYEHDMNHSFDDADDISNNEIFSGVKIKDNARLERRALLETLQQHKIIVTIPLRTDLSVGNVIQLQLPGGETGGSDNPDSVNDDRYLITDLNVNGSPNEATGVCYIECVKESYALPIQDATPLAKVAPPQKV